MSRPRTSTEPLGPESHFSEPRRSRFFKARYALLLGRYQSTEPVEAPAHELLIGRKRQRSFLLGALFSTARKGAFLITGHRGSGKTTFVHHVLSQYRRAVYSRYLNSNTGRSVADRLMLTVFAGALIAVGVLMSDLIQSFAFHRSPSFLQWVVASCLAFLLAYPMRLAFEALRTAFFDRLLYPSSATATGRREPRPEEGTEALPRRPLRHTLEAVARRCVYGWCRHPRSSAWATLVVLAVLAFTLGPFAYPAIGLSQLLAVTAWCYMAVATLSAAPATSLTEIRWDQPFYTVKRPEWRERWLPVVLVGIPLAACVLGFLPAPELTAPEAQTRFRSAAGLWTLTYWAVAFLATAGASGFRFFDVRSLRRALAASDRSGADLLDDRPGDGEGPRPGSIIGEAALWAALACVSSSLLFVVASALIWSPAWDRYADPARSRQFILLATVIFLATVFAGVWRRLAFRRRGEGTGNKDEDEKRAHSFDPPVFQMHPRPGLILALKAVTAIVFALQLLHPFVGMILRRRTAPLPEGTPIAASLFGAFAESRPVFQGLGDEIPWIATGLALLLTVFVREYSWIVQPFAPFLPSQLELGTDDEPEDCDRSSKRADMLTKQTFFWKIFDSWLPVLVVHVNLGIDKLGNRNVIEAMLAGLRNEYERRFLHWSDPFTALRRIAILGIAFLAAVGVGDHWLGLDRAGLEALEKRHFCADTMVPESLGAADKTVPQFLLCKIGGETLIQVLQWSPTATRDRRSPPPRFGSAWDEATTTGSAREEFVKHSVLEAVFQLGDKTGSLLVLRVYHLVLFPLLLFLFVGLSRFFGALPFKITLRRIEALLDGLSHRLHQEESSGSPSWPSWLPLPRYARRAWKEGGPFDPRTVELEFLRVLRDIQDPTAQLPISLTRSLSPPLPEVVFVFDELDKLGLERRSPKHGAAAQSEKKAPFVDHERQRFQAVLTMLSDLKNLLSSGSARFFFIGGRNLHDEWLADRSSRQPILSSIFDAEIYLPSLLLERNDQEVGPFGAVQSFLRRHQWRAQVLQGRAQRLRVRPWMTHASERRLEPTFPSDGRSQLPIPEIGEFHDCSSGRRISWESRIGRDFRRFLAYRSRGDIKRLKELVESFLQPAPRSWFSSDRAALEPGAQHALVLEDRDLRRIQMIATILQPMHSLLRSRIELGDDKLARSLLYISDFLLKFHRRAFTWSSLERVDELVHIHRAPDLRPAIRELVGAWTGRFLHRIRNGMYDFRFQSGFAREIEFLSRSSDEELAALNFTLDESQVLKAIYRARLESPSESGLDEVVAALAELHDLDEEHETARQLYLQAIDALDRAFSGEEESEAKLATRVWNVVLRQEEGLEAARTRASWAVSRIRLMLEIGMTYERASDLEHAQVWYQDARTFAAAIQESFLRTQAMEIDGEAHAGGSVANRPRNRLAELNYIASLKHLNILFQPLFAEVWTAEKMASGVDTGPALLEEELWKLRLALPFVHPRNFRRKLRAKSSMDFRHSNFALVMAELHNKAGNLYFFKGGQPVRPEHRGGSGETGLALGAVKEGYLARAAYHYSIALHEIRRFNHYRVSSSQAKFDPRTGPRRTLHPLGWADFVYRTTAGALVDLAEVSFASMSILRLMEEGPRSPRSAKAQGDVWKDLDDFAKGLTGWLSGQERPARRELDSVMGRLFPGHETSMSRMDHVFGRKHRGLWPWRRDSRELVRLHRKGEADLLATSVLLSFSAARLLRRGNYLESASREYARLAEMINRFLWLVRSFEFLREPTDDPWSANGGRELLRRLVSIALLSLDEAFRHGRDAAPSQSAEPGELDMVVPCSLVRMACSTRLAAKSLQLELERDQKAVKRAEEGLTRSVKAYFPANGVVDLGGRSGVRELVRRLLTEKSYPIANRLEGLKLLIDDHVLARGPDRDSAESLRARLDELLDLKRQYDSRLHFTPLQSGLTTALAWVHANREGGQNGELFERYCREAFRDLRVSEEMCTMRRAYYEEIARLHYLYDDFNDRTVHFNQASQAAGAEVGELARRVLRSERTG